MNMIVTAQAERLNAVEAEDGERKLEEKLRRATDHTEEIRLLMEYARHPPKTKRNSTENA